MKEKLLLLCLFCCMASGLAAQQITLAEARAGGTGQVVTVTGIVTNGNEFDSRIRYFQDATGGIAVFGPGSANLVASERGDSVVLTGTTDDFNGLFQISEGAGDLTFDIVSTETQEPEPFNATVADMVEANEGTLMIFEDVAIVEGGGFFSGSTNYTFVDGTGAEGQLRITFSGHELAGTEIPSGTVTLIGLLSEFRGTYQLLPRDAADLVVGLALEGFSQDNINTRSFDLSWTTNIRTNTNLRFRELPNGVFDTIRIDESVLTHAVSLPGLQPATFYEVQGFSETTDGKVAASSLNIMTTKSESSGQMFLYFNQPVATEFATEEAAVYVENAFADTIANYIDRAQFTVDVAVFNANRDGAGGIVESLNAAHARGIRVRYITDADNANTALDNLDPAIPVVRDNNPEGIMHNKFCIVDYASTQQSWLINGSNNWTDNNLNEDANNLIIIQDEAMTRAFTLEFEEMWGSTGAQPNTEVGAFGPAKVRNTPSQFIIGDIPVEVFFSPTDRTSSEVFSALNTVSSDLRFALLLLTRNELADQIITADTLGWSVKGIIDDTTDILGSDFDELVFNNIDVSLFQQSTASGVLHHKYAIIDALRPDSDPMVITGSYNWSTAATELNDENVMIIHDANIANQFLQEFRQRYVDVTGTPDDILTGIDDLVGSELQLFPNPTSGVLNITLQPQRSQLVRFALLDMSGRTVWQRQQPAAGQRQNQYTFTLPDQQNGLYVLVAQFDQKQIIKKITLNR